MAAKPRKIRPNSKADALSDAQSRNVIEANRTLGYARASPAEIRRTVWQCRRATCEQPARNASSASVSAARRQGAASKWGGQVAFEGATARTPLRRSGAELQSAGASPAR